jgi:hypothetical protein
MYCDADGILPLMFGSLAGTRLHCMVYTVNCRGANIECFFLSYYSGSTPLSSQAITVSVAHWSQPIRFSGVRPQIRRKNDKARHLLVVPFNVQTLHREISAFNISWSEL